MMRKLIAIALLAIASLASLAAFANRGNGGAVRGAAARAGMMAQIGDYWGLGFHSENGGSGYVTMAKSGSAPSVNLEYSIGGYDWSPFVVGVTTARVSGIQTVYFRAPEGSVNSAMATSDANYNRFIVSGDLTCHGSIGSLIRSDIRLTYLDKAYAFSHLFYNTTGMRGMPELLGTNTKTMYNYLFYNSGCGPRWENTSVKKMGNNMFTITPNLKYIYTEANNADNDRYVFFGNGGGSGEVYAPNMNGYFGEIYNCGYKMVWLPEVVYQDRQNVSSFGNCDFIYTPKFKHFGYLGQRDVSITVKNWDWASVDSFYHYQSHFYITQNLWVTNSTLAQCSTYVYYSQITNENKRTSLTIHYKDGKHNWNGSEWIFTPNP